MTEDDSAKSRGTADSVADCELHESKRYWDRAISLDTTGEETRAYTYSDIILIADGKDHKGLGSVGSVVAQWTAHRLPVLEGIDVVGPVGDRHDVVESTVWF